MTFVTKDTAPFSGASPVVSGHSDGVSTGRRPVSARLSRVIPLALRQARELARGIFEPRQCRAAIDRDGGWQLPYPGRRRGPRWPWPNHAYWSRRRRPRFRRVFASPRGCTARRCTHRGRPRLRAARTSVPTECRHGSTCCRCYRLPPFLPSCRSPGHLVFKVGGDDVGFDWAREAQGMALLTAQALTSRCAESSRP